MFVETARAKVNLNLHVGRLIKDPTHPYNGYHPLSSLVVFAAIGDGLSCEEAKSTSLEISGPNGEGLEADSRNLILRAYEAVSAKAALPLINFHLVKNLPVASGIGGGSADAGAALRLLKNFVDLPDSDWMEIARSLGADVPVCFHSKTCLMTGIGEQLSFISDWGTEAALLVNPGLPLSTKQVFQHFDGLDSRLLIDVAPMNISADGRNDLQYSAIELTPEIQTCLDVLKGQKGCLVHRMSGSGATCFGIFEATEQAQKAEYQLQQLFPHWWIKSTMLGDG